MRVADEGAVAVIVDEARPAEVSAMLVDAYGLTPASATYSATSC